jgi:pimeloyl-ACP methyl ester carboxylesterase
MATRLQVSGPQGRALEVELSGPDDGQALVFHSGTPDAGTMFEPLVALGAQRGLRHIAYSRPGYSTSDRHEGRSVGDCAQDVAAILDHLGIERVFMIGVSGGGPHCLACAALLPERTIAAASIAGVAPYGADGLDWSAGMAQENLEEFAAVQAGQRELVGFLERQRTELIGVTGEQLAEALGDLISPPDRAALTGAFADYLAANFAEAVAEGIWGWFDDDIAIVGDWGFDLGTIARPVSIWQGRDDRFVPPAHGDWLVRHVPGARARLRDEEGHLSIAIGSYAEILDDLLANADRR